MFTFGAPHGYCYFWAVPLTSLHVISDVVIALSYFAIPLLILRFLRWEADRHISDKLKDILFWSSAFIICCGASHLFEIATIWLPIYWISGIHKAITAVVSAMTAWKLLMLQPHLQEFLGSLTQALQELELKIAQLSESEERFRVFQDNSPATSFMKQDGVLVYANRKLIQDYGAIVGRRDRDFLPELDASVIERHDKYVLESGEPLSAIESAPDLSGVYRRWLILKFRLVLSSGIFLAGVGIDVTEQEHLRNELYRLNEELESKSKQLLLRNQQLQEIDRIKDDFISTVSHELRTPITNIKMAIKMLRTMPDQDKQLQYMSILERECAREISLINDLLDLQKLEAQKEQVRLETFNFSQWVTTFMEVFTPRLSVLQQRLKVDLPDEPVFLHTDLAKLERILTELLTNASKYTLPGKAIELVVVATPGSPVALMIKNEAEIPAHLLPHIFDRFYRVPQSDINRQGGTGLGLALVQRLAILLGCELTVESTAGITTFSLLFHEVQ